MRGVADKIHSYPEANQFCYGLSGEIEELDGDKVSFEGILAFFPIGEKHGATNVTKESIVLFYWDGPPTTEV